MDVVVPCSLPASAIYFIIDFFFIKNLPIFEIKGAIFSITAFRHFMSAVAVYWQSFLKFKSEMFFRKN